MNVPAHEHRALLRRADQIGVAALVLAGFLGLGVWWWWQGGLSGGLVDLETAEPRQAKFAVDLNTAAWTELAQIPEIGEALARRIVESRKVDGPFVKLDALDRVPGIGPRTLEQMRPYLQPIPQDENVVGP